MNQSTTLKRKDAGPETSNTGSKRQKTAHSESTPEVESADEDMEDVDEDADMSEEEVDAEEYAHELRQTALDDFDRQANPITHQGVDATLLRQLLKLASYATDDDATQLTTEQINDLQLSGDGLPARAIVTDYGVPDDAPHSLTDVALRVAQVYGGSSTKFIPQVKNRKFEEVLHGLATVEEFIAHFSNNNDLTGDKEIWNLLEAGVQMFPGAFSWIPGFITRENLLYDIRARSINPMRPSNSRFTDKMGWYLAADGGAYSSLHFDSHGFLTFLLILSGEILLIFGNDIKTDKYRKIMLDAIREPEFNKAQKELYAKHIRFVVLKPGQMWVMEPGTLHAVYRKEGTVIFGGHSVPKKNLGLWIEKMKEHLTHYAATNEEPSEILMYVERTLELVANADVRDKHDEFGGTDEIVRFLRGAQDLMFNGPEWMRKDGYQKKDFIIGFEKKAKRLLKKHAALFDMITKHDEMDS